MTSPTERRKAIIFLVCTSLLWSTSGVFVKALDWSPLAILSGRGLFTTILFLIYMRRLPKHITRWTLIAAVGSALTQLLFITSTKLTTAANAIFLQYTAPIYVIPLAYWLLREKPSRNDWIAMGVIFSGLLLFFGDQLSPSGFYGNILAIISGVTSAVMMVAFRAQKDGSPEDSILIASFIMFLVGAPFLFQASATLTDWSIVAYLGIFQIGLAFILFAKGIKHVPALEANLIGMLESILNPLWVFLFLGESVGKFALLGGLIVLTGVIISAVGSTQSDHEAKLASAIIDPTKY